MNRFPLSLVVASALAAAFPSLAAAAPLPPVTAVPSPLPVVIWLSPTRPHPTPAVEFYDGGAGLPNLGAATEYEAGDWENVLRSFHDLGGYDRAIAQIDDLAKARGIAVFFVSERRENTRDHTVSNLVREGYAGWAQLLLKADDSTQSTVQYKTSARAGVEQQGYRIVASVGDQYSDFAGGRAGIGFKLPNPFYFRP